MNFVILFVFSTIVFTVISKSTEDNTVNVGKSPEDNTVSEKSVPGRRNGECKSERVTHHSVSKSNGKKLRNEDKSVDTHAKEIDAWIEELPQDQRYGARRAHGEWLGRVKGRETKLKCELDKADMFQLLLAITSRVDQLEETYAPSENFKGVQRSKRWLKILAMETPAVEELRNKIRSAGMTEHSFAKTVERLVNERNNLAGHAKIPLPSLVREKTIEGALQIMEITEDHEAVETLKILVDPVKRGDLTSVKTSENPEERR